MTISHFCKQNPHTMSPYPNGQNLGYATIAYANGLGYFDHKSDNVEVPWKDYRIFDKSQYEDPDFRMPAMMPPPEESETHGGEDVGIFAVGDTKDMLIEKVTSLLFLYKVGPMAHLLNGVHEQSYIGHVMAFAACMGDYIDDCERPQRNGQLVTVPSALIILFNVLIAKTLLQ